MADVSMTTAAEPDGAPRIAVLDILRGIAILGILFMNINDMGGSLTASFEDIRHLGWSVTDQAAWWAREVLANGTARCLLEMLFGAGMVILTDRAATKVGGWRVMGGYYARNIVLFLFGLVHVFILLWPGDILHTYGLAALVAYLFRRLRPRFLLPIGLIMAMVILFVGGGFTLYNQHQRAEATRIEAKVAAGTPITKVERKLLDDRAKRKAERVKREAKTQADIAKEDKARTGDFRSWADAQWMSFLELQGKGLELLFVWEAASTMLIGAALFKMGIIQGRRSPRYYLGLTVIAYTIAIPLRIWGGLAMTDFSGTGGSLAGVFYEVARLSMTLGHIGLINLLLTSVVGARLLQPFVAAGRTALTVYIAQTLICLWVLYPPFMLGLYGKTTWAPMMVTAFVINAALLWGANRWVKHYDIAPVEWAWRSLIERRLLPWRKARPAAASAPPAAEPLPA